jgi:hypothetical protein
MPGPTGAGLPSNTFVTPTSRETNNIFDYNAQTNDPLSSIRQATRQTLFSSKDTEVSERLGEVLAVDMSVKLPSDLNYFGDPNVSVEYGSRDWVCVICRILDLHSATPDPSQTVSLENASPTFADVTRLRANIGKFYIPVDELRSKGATNIEIGDWLTVEFQDKNLLTNGIIKGVYLKRDVTTLTEDSSIPSAQAPYGVAGGKPVRPLANSGQKSEGKYIPYKNPFGAALVQPGSGYGLRFHPVDNKDKPHRGVDFPVPVGTPIYALAPGKIAVKANDSNGWGYYIKIAHDDGTYSLYAHMKNPSSFRVGDSVKQGQQIGLSGRSGKSTGPHLHLELYDKDNKQIDPSANMDFNTPVPTT